MDDYQFCNWEFNLQKWKNSVWFYKSVRLHMIENFLSYTKAIIVQKKNFERQYDIFVRLLIWFGNFFLLYVILGQTKTYFSLIGTVEWCESLHWSYRNWSESFSKVIGDTVKY